MSRGAGFQRQAQPPARGDRSAEFASFVMARPATAVQARADQLHKAPAAIPAKLSRAQRTDDDIRQSANGEDCHMRLEGVCNGRTDTTVWSHWPGMDGDRGMGLKALDAAGCYCCAACHDAIDSRAKPPAGMVRRDVVLAWMFGHLRSLVTLARKGLL